MALVRALPDTDRPFKRANARSVVTDYLRRLIYEGTLREGDRVPQQEIAEKLGVSRIPVRESLVALEGEGIVTIEPHRGAFVNRFDAASIADHYELYGMVYGHAARCAAERADDEDRARIRSVCGDVESAQDPEAMLRAAGHFRSVLISAGGSPSLRGLMHSLVGVVPGNFFAVVPDAMAVAKSGFRLVTDAIERRDGAAAATHSIEMMRAHGRNVNRGRERTLASAAVAERTA